MALEREIARLSKILVDTKKVSFEEAQSLLRSMTLEIVVGAGADSLAAHTAILTAVSVGRRCFVGGVRVVGNVDQPVVTALPYNSNSLGETCAKLGACSFDGDASFRITVGACHPVGIPTVAVHWNGWTAGIRATPGDTRLAADGSNPLTGLVAGALAVGYGFDHLRGSNPTLPADVDLWGDLDAPSFPSVFLPGEIWIVGLGNLGQAFLWALGSLPYADAKQVSVHLQDFDRVTPENWGTSVLVSDESYGALKGKVAEEWVVDRGFNARRIDRRLQPSDRVAGDDPALAFSGVDKVAARRGMAATGFEAIIDAGLGRTAAKFDKFRVNVFNSEHTIEAHCVGLVDSPPAGLPDDPSYAALAESIGQCGAAEIAGASVAVPHVSAIAGALAVARAIALVSGFPVPLSQCRRAGDSQSGRAPVFAMMDCRRLRHAGRPLQLLNRAPHLSA